LSKKKGLSVKLLICAGGTGGGVNPALAVLHNVESSMSPVDTLWVGGVGGMEADLVKREGVPFEVIPAAGVHGVGLRTLPRNLWKLFQGLRAARRLLKRFQPDVLLFTGGFVAVPMALAARWSFPVLWRFGRSSGARRSKSLLYVPDIEPGLALKTLARFADAIAITAEEGRAFFKSKNVAVTGYPVRNNLKVWQVADARRVLGLSHDLPTLLVTGGSTGARSINRALMSVLPDLLAEMQVVHLTGKLDWPEVDAFRGTLPADKAVHYHAFPYLHDEIGAAFSAADLVVSRAGASCLGEFPMFGLPAILVPYPYAWRYQRVNADYLARHHAALVVEDADLPGKILPLVRALIQDESRRGQMREAMQALYRPQAAANIAKLLQSLVNPEKDAAYG
jgi:UDP-N-acetylglucosamine--N-acetylmuramyl-(pentapeptide) pyrophosphoryl-undecaprenol N-acetylglucosamine transferase